MTQDRAGPLRVLSAGAAKGVVQALAGVFEDETGIGVDATFDSAGAVRDAFAGGAACDIVILPAAMQETLASQGRIDRESIAALGRVPTGVAVASADPLPSVADADALRASLVAASALYCPDTARATAGIQFAGVLRALGIYEASLPKLHAHPNGARAMVALAESGARGAIGCTQISEILYTPGVTLVAPLPAPFELTTIYAVAVSSDAASPAGARAVAARRTGSETQALRRAAGFLELQSVNAAASAP
ncbi:MAG: molybdate ABC transporter substrate-binding protein [Burkholderiales bacterium]